MTAPTPPHKPSCAKRIRAEIVARGGAEKEAATAIAGHCEVSSLRAHRLARGQTLAEAAAGMRLLAGAAPSAPKVERNQLGWWETGARTPRLSAVELLCRYYEATPLELGLVELAVTAPAEAVAVRASGIEFPAMQAASGSLQEHLDGARRATDHTLARGSTSPGQLDLLEERLLLMRGEYLYTPPAEMLAKLLPELGEVGSYSQERQTTSVHVRLTEMTAVLSTLIADSLMKLGDIRRSRGWYETARNAAEESGNVELRARVMSQAAMLPFYYGPLDAAVAWAREARLLTMHRRPSPTSSFAAAAEARALAHQGNVAAARARAQEAQDLFDRLPPSSEDDAFGFPARRLMLYLSGTYTALGESSRARRFQDEALAMYPSRTGIDPALLQLERAICLAHERSATEACQLASATYLTVPEPHRTPIVGARARRVIEVLPGANARTRAANELRELLELPAGTM
ncbi:helix-turn-helix transcriptional regulator [Streptomyces sp. NBC_00160]|uniref:helix-turn-helix domain-containing protein n=1 Tax=Streptomyces sp. NBC_00160 TaxID=2903628 RepID=UPI00225C0BF1|nr:helix-turn-helix transcriptional regulator [Streptomyces sp. NBC_00160]MCX5302803.1 helix-turn-helix transcriptional regulator [Streptomyces sp. NBC_00160]